MSDCSSRGDNDMLQEQLSTYKDVLGSWLYALEKLSEQLVEDNSLFELVAEIKMENYFFRWGLKWRLFNNAFNACEWFIGHDQVSKFIIGPDSFKLFGKEEGIIEVEVPPGCPYGPEHNMSVCNWGLIFIVVIRRCTGLDYEYTLQKASGKKGCRFLLKPSSSKVNKSIFTKKQAINLLDAFTNEAEASMPGLIERTGKSFAEGITGGLAESLAEFKRTGLGNLTLEKLDLTNNKAFFSGVGLLQGSAGKMDVAMDSFTKGFLSGLVGRLAGVDAICEEMTCIAKGDDRCTFVVDTAREAERSHLRKITQVTGKIGFIPTLHHLALVTANDLELPDSRIINLKLVQNHSWTELANSLRRGKLDGAMIMAPLAMRLREEGVPIKVVALGNREGTGLVIKNTAKLETPRDFFAGASLLGVAYRYSTESVLLHKWLKELQMEGQALLKRVSVPADLMLNNVIFGEIDGFMGPEPYVTEAALKGEGQILARSGEIWPGHMCCVLVLTMQFVNKHPEAAAQLVNSLRRAGELLHADKQLAPRISTKHFELPQDLVVNVLREKRISYDNLEPDLDQFDQYQEIMLETGLLKEKINMEEFVDKSFWML